MENLADFTLDFFLGASIFPWILPVDFPSGHTMACKPTLFTPWTAAAQPARESQEGKLLLASMIEAQATTPNNQMGMGQYLQIHF